MTISIHNTSFSCDIESQTAGWISALDVVTLFVIHCSLYAKVKQNAICVCQVKSIHHWHMCSFSCMCVCMYAVHEHKQMVRNMFSYYGNTSAMLFEYNIGVGGPKSFRGYSAKMDDK